ncbi:ATP-dependent Lon protease pim1 [Gonapodya sp. JEL0774]|nr:ATP-dependent Lon protease pim1 [Gonapodya sp. JEL0774]
MSEDNRSGASSPSPSLSASPSPSNQQRRSDGHRLALNYQRLLEDFGKVKAQNSVLKRAIIEEQTGTKYLQVELKLKEDEIRKAQEAHDISRLHNERLTKQLKSLQDELALREVKEYARNCETQYVDARKHLEIALTRVEDLQGQLEAMARENRQHADEQEQQARNFDDEINGARGSDATSMSTALAAAMDTAEAFKDAISVYEQVRGDGGREEVNNPLKRSHWSKHADKSMHQDVILASSQVVKAFVHFLSMYTGLVEGVLRRQSQNATPHTEIEEGAINVFLKRTVANLNRTAERLGRSSARSWKKVSSMETELMALLVNWFIDWEAIWYALQAQNEAAVTLAAQAVMVTIIDAVRNSSSELGTSLALPELVTIATSIGDNYFTIAETLEDKEAFLSESVAQVKDFSGRVSDYVSHVIPDLESQISRIMTEKSELVDRISASERKLSDLETERLSREVLFEKTTKQLEKELEAARVDGESLRQTLAGQSRQLLEQGKEIENVVAKSKTKDEWISQLERTVKSLQRRVKDPPPSEDGNRTSELAAKAFSDDTTDVLNQSTTTNEVESRAGRGDPASNIVVNGVALPLLANSYPAFRGSQVLPLNNLSREELEVNVRYLTLTRSSPALASSSHRRPSKLVTNRSFGYLPKVRTPTLPHNWKPDAPHRVYLTLNDSVSRRRATTARTPGVGIALGNHFDVFPPASSHGDSRTSNFQLRDGAVGTPVTQMTAVNPVVLKFNPVRQLALPRAFFDDESGRAPSSPSDGGSDGISNGPPGGSDNDDSSGGSSGGAGGKGRKRGPPGPPLPRASEQTQKHPVEAGGEAGSIANSGGSAASPPGESDNGNGSGSSGDESGNGSQGSKVLSLPTASSLAPVPSDITSGAIEKPPIPKEYPQLLAIPLTRRPLFPGFYKTVYIKDPAVIAAIHDLVARRQPYVGVFMTKDDNYEPDIVSDMEQVHRIGVFAQIANVYASGPDNSGLTVLLYPHRRIRANGLVLPEKLVPVAENALGSEKAKIEAVEKILSTETSVDEPPSVPVQEDVADPLHIYESVNVPLSKFDVSLANVENLADEPYNPDTPLVKAITNEMLNVMKEISQLNPLFRDQIITFSIQAGGSLLSEPSRLADFAAAVSSADPTELQAILESLVVEERLHKALLVVKKELANAKLQQEIAKEVDKKITRKQQEYFLMEQLKGIKKELGIDSDGKDKLIEKFKERATGLQMPEAVQKVFDEEIQKLSTLESAASEFNVTRNYLDWITQIPWGKYADENFEIAHAIKVLDEDHYGLKEVKDRILEFIAVGKLRGTVEGKILCLSGPPGVGKTSVGKSIARALNRDFFRFSVGGLSDVAEIKGHRRTYVGAMPGKVIQALKKVQSQNPLILIDEIDKLGRGHQGDPASALLEVLDPEQNSSFLDHYMDVPIDLSKVLFVCTANVLETIPPPLLDRMEVISLSGYVAEEKVAISERYLAPQARASSGLQDADVELTTDAIESLIKYYCRESGVRNLKKQIEKVYRKAALQIVKDASANSPSAAAPEVVSEDLQDVPTPPASAAVVAPLRITSDNLKTYVGSPVFTSDRMYDHTPAGVVMGLAWTSLGGSALYVESVLEAAMTKDSKPNLSRTGQLGDVMKESSMIAYTFAKAFLLRKDPQNDFFSHAKIHLHVPEGATPKDGPSAGVTMATSLLSLAMNEPVLPNVAMTGELTLTGKVLKIGGLREKTIAAKRSGVTKIIFPALNKNDWDEFPDYIREGISGIPVETYEDIFNIVFAAEEESAPNMNAKVLEGD